VVLIGSLLIVVHLLAVTAGALARFSGPWNTPNGPAMYTPPQFAYTLDQLFGGRYLTALRLAPEPNVVRPGMTEAWLEVKLKDEAGHIIATRRLPEESANPWVRQRQQQLVRWFIEDQPVLPPMMETIAAPNKAVRKVGFWQLIAPHQVRLREVPEHLLPRDGAFQPSEWMMVLVRAYARGLCRETGAHAAEIVRHSREPIPPAILFANPAQRGDFEELTSSFGDMTP
jgi:hypothetical protein